MTVRNALTRLIGSETPQAAADRKDQDDRMDSFDQRLHDLASRLHVLEAKAFMHGKIPPLPKKDATKDIP